MSTEEYVAPSEPGFKTARTRKGAQVLAAVEKELRREVAIGEAEGVAVVLWTAHTYGYSGFKLTPRLFATSEDPGSGKSTLLGIVRDLSANGRMLKRITTAYLGRVSDNENKPTLCVDQLDNSISKQRTGELIDALCAGGEKGALYGLTELVKNDKGEERREAAELDLFYPVALGKIGPLPDRALADRCITVRMHPATEAEDAALAKHAKGEASEKVRGQLAAWVLGLRDLSGKRPEMPEGFRGRTRDKWRPLLAIADAAGGDWPARARAAAIELEDPSEREDPGHVVMLRNLLAAIPADWPHAQIFTSELRELGFQDFANSAALLPRVGLKSKPVRRGEQVARGFKIAEIRAAAARYRVTDVTDVGEMAA